MDDLIKKQTALEEIDNTYFSDFDDYERTKTVIERIPAEQPPVKCIANVHIDADKIEYEDMLRPRGNGNYEECQIAYRDQIDDIPTAQPEVRTEMSSADLISRQALMKEFSDFVRASNSSDFAQTPTWNDAVSLVGSMPPADVRENVKGEWLPQDHNKTNGMMSTAVYYYPKCSVCGHCGNYTNFCPNCGAQMRGENT